MSSKPVQTETERLRQLELEIEQASSRSMSVSKASDPSLTDPSSETQSLWSNPWILLIGGIGVLVGVGLLFKLIGWVIKLAIVAGIGYLIYRFAIAPRLKSGS